MCLTINTEIKDYFPQTDPSSGLILFDQSSLGDGDSELISEEEGDEVKGICCFRILHEIDSEFKMVKLTIAIKRQWLCFTKKSRPTDASKKQF